MNVVSGRKENFHHKKDRYNNGKIHKRNPVKW